MSFGCNLKNYYGISQNDSMLAHESKQNTYLSQEFLDCAKSLFNILDSESNGYVTIEELQKHFDQSVPPKIIRKQGKFCKIPDLPSILQQICPSNGFINFKRFILALQIALGKCDLNSNNGIGRSLRPLSYLFAVTESSETESDAERDERRIELSADSTDKSCPDGSLIGKKLANEEQESMYYHMEEKNASDVEDQKPEDEVGLLNQCLYEVSKVADVYNSRLKQLKMEWHQTTRTDLSGYHSPPSADYIHVGFHISNVMKMNQRLHDFQKSRKYAQGKSATENGSHPLLRKMEELSGYIGQIEMEKASLVKDVFHLKAKLSAVTERKDQTLPF